jgi:hypothetical protein
MFGELQRNIHFCNNKTKECFLTTIKVRDDKKFANIICTDNTNIQVETSNYGFV